MSLAALVAIVALCAAVTTAVFVRVAPRFGLVDVPNARSSHAVPVPRGGGVALLVGAAIGVVVARPFDTGGVSPAALAVGAGALLVALVGLADDRYGLSPLPKLLAQVAAAVLVVAAVGGLERLPLPAPLDVALGPLGAALGVLWIVAVVNFYNFMDGIDGIASLQGAVTGTGLALAAWSAPAALLGGALAGGCLGFLLHNWSPARVFLGDVGSGMLGFACAAAPFLAVPAERPAATLFVALSLWLFLADAAWTLGARVVRGARWHEAHREHAYQRLVMAGWSHPRVAALVGAGSALLTALALAAWRSGMPALWWSALAVAVALAAAEIAGARRAASRPAGGGAARVSA
jgi:UDP-N-acetylmuramyl pentapeptide phosphotransferase/UDP-N-acetylglucosamine-1-phosphate transferase